MEKANIKALTATNLLAFGVIFVFLNFYRPQYQEVAEIIKAIINLELLIIPYGACVVAFCISSIVLIYVAVNIAIGLLYRFLSSYFDYFYEKYLGGYSIYLDNLETHYVAILLGYSFAVLPLLTVVILPKLLGVIILFVVVTFLFS